VPRITEESPSSRENEPKTSSEWKIALPCVERRRRTRRSKAWHLTSVVIFEARCDDCHERIVNAFPNVPSEYSGAKPLIMDQFTDVMSRDAMTFYVSVSTTWVVTNNFAEMAKSMVLCYDCQK